MYHCCMSTSAPHMHFCNKDVLKTNVQNKKTKTKTVILEENSATAHTAGGCCLQELPKILMPAQFQAKRLVPLWVWHNYVYHTCQCSYRHLFIDFMVPGYSGSCWVHLQVTVPAYDYSGSTQCYKIWLQQQYQLHFYSGSTWLYLTKVTNTLTGTWVKQLAVVVKPLHLHLHLCLVTAAVAGYCETEYLVTAEVPGYKAVPCFSGSHYLATASAWLQQQQLTAVNLVTQPFSRSTWLQMYKAVPCFSDCYYLATASVPGYSSSS